MNVKETYEGQVKNRLQQLDKQIEELAAEIDKQAGAARTESQKQLDALKDQRKEINKRLQAIQDAGSSAWEDLRQGMDNALDALGKSIDKARTRFEKVV